MQLKNQSLGKSNALHITFSLVGGLSSVKYCQMETFCCLHQISLFFFATPKNYS